MCPVNEPIGMLVIADEKELNLLGSRLAAILQPGDRIALSGDLGAGKTTLARAVIKSLGFDEEVPSPTFAIVQQYEPPDLSIPVVHADFYRIEEPEEIIELGLDEMIENAILLAEWPDRLPHDFWDNALNLNIAIEADSKRRLTWTAGPAWKDRWPLT